MDHSSGIHNRATLHLCPPVQADNPSKEMFQRGEVLAAALTSQVNQKIKDQCHPANDNVSAPPTELPPTTKETRSAIYDVLAMLLRLFATRAALHASLRDE